MIDSTIVLFVIAIAVVLSTSLLKMPWFTTKQKSAIAGVMSVIAAAVHTWVTGDFDTTDLMSMTLQVYGGSQLIYQFILDKTGIDDKLELLGSGVQDDEA